MICVTKTKKRASPFAAGMTGLRACLMWPPQKTRSTAVFRDCCGNLTIDADKYLFDNEESKSILRSTRSKMDEEKLLQCCNAATQKIFISASSAVTPKMDKKGTLPPMPTPQRAQQTSYCSFLANSDTAPSNPTSASAPSLFT